MSVFVRVIKFIFFLIVQLNLLKKLLNSLIYSWYIWMEKYENTRNMRLLALILLIFMNIFDAKWTKKKKEVS